MNSTLFWLTITQNNTVTYGSVYLLLDHTSRQPVIIAYHQQSMLCFDTFNKIAAVSNNFSIIVKKKANMAGKIGTRIKQPTSQTAHAPKRPRGRPRKKIAENSLQEIEMQFDSDSSESSSCVKSQRKITKTTKKNNCLQSSSSIKSKGMN